MYLLVTCPFEVDLLWVAPHTVIIVSISLFFHWSHKDCVSIIIITNEEVIVTSCKLMRESSRLIYVGLFCFRWTWDGVEVIPCFLWYFYWVVDWRLFFLDRGDPSVLLPEYRVTSWRLRCQYPARLWSCHFLWHLKGGYARWEGTTMLKLGKFCLWFISCDDVFFVCL